MRRQGKGTEKNSEGFAPYATTKNVDICRGVAGRLMRGREELWAGHLYEREQKIKEEKITEAKRRGRK